VFQKRNIEINGRRSYESDQGRIQRLWLGGSGTARPKGLKLEGRMGRGSQPLSTSEEYGGALYAPRVGFEAKSHPLFNYRRWWIA